MNFTPFGNHFTSMHQFTTVAKVSNSQVQPNAMLVSTTSNVSHYHHTAPHNHVSFPNNNQMVGATVVPPQHHQDVRPLMNQNSLPQPPTTTQSNWGDLNLNRVPNEPNKTPINIPTFSMQTAAHSNQPLQWPVKTVMTQNASTMTDLEKPENLCKNGNKDNGSSDDSDDSSKSSTNENHVSYGWDSCSKIHLKHQGNAMAEYLARLQPSSIPLSIQQFLQRHNIKTVLDNTNSRKKTFDSMKVKPCEIRISTALDGSTLFCCPECHMAYPHRDLLEQHMTVHKTERRFECNVCGVCLKRKEHLDQHRRGHSEERPFVCAICCKGFKRNEHLRRHIVIHSGDKTHACTECGKAFSRKDHLNKHVQTHITKRVKSENSETASVIGHVDASQLHQLTAKQM